MNGIFSSFLDDPEDFQEYKKGVTGDGGVNNSNDADREDYVSLQDKKLKAETKKIDINNEKELNNLVERKMVHSFIAAIGQSIQMNLVNFARINSPELAAILEIPEKEIKINEFLSDRIGLSLDNVKKDIEKFNSDKMFE